MWPLDTHLYCFDFDDLLSKFRMNVKIFCNLNQNRMSVVYGELSKDH